MKELKHIRTRIQHRQGSRGYQSHTTRYPSDHRPNWLYRIAVTGMVVLLLVLIQATTKHTAYYQQAANMVVQAKDAVVKVISTSFLARFIPFEDWFQPSKEQPVSSSTYYTPGSQKGYFQSESNEAAALYDGLVVYIGDEKGKKWIVVHHDNALYATYGSLTEVHVKLYDRIKKGDHIGSFQTEIQLEFLYDSNEITYEEALGLEEH